MPLTWHDTSRFSERTDCGRYGVSVVDNGSRVKLVVSGMAWLLPASDARPKPSPQLIDSCTAKTHEAARRSAKKLCEEHAAGEISIKTPEGESAC